ncbi:uncharacterized protein [Gossypium hirsutum]|uniref:Retrotransposon gag domain-containing protein n=1 Tax=Gossypium hirsutum TaxID=3635 RepID=A0A1U8NIQ4_GOSHI|nr:uncharacterized protein LOC107947866 [Gossypium hirsutum]
MIDEWFGDCLRNHPNIPRPPPPPARFEEEVPQGMALVRICKALVDKLRKYGAEEFRATIDDDPEYAEFWFENTTRVLDELSCTPAKCLKCTVSLLKDSVYRWWKTISSVTPRESITWEFFQAEFKKKYISQRFLDQKRKELLELKQGNRTVSEYEREFIRLSQYAKKWVETEAEMCKCFEEGLNEEIKLLIWILEIRELVALVDRAKKVEELNNERMQANKEARVSSKRSSNKSHLFPTKKSRSHQKRSTASV